MRKYFVLNIIFAIILSMICLSSCGSKSMKKAKELVEVGMYDEAIPLLEMEVHEHPKDAKAHFLLGKAYLRTGEEENAQKSFNRVIMLNPNLRSKVAEEHIVFALELFKEGKRRQSEAMFNRALHFDEEAGEKIAAEIFFKQGKELIDSDIKTAIEFLEAAAYYNRSLREKIAEILFKRGKELSDSNFEEAIECLDLAVQLDSSLKEQAAKEVPKFSLRLTMQDMRSTGEALEIYQIDYDIYPETIDQLHPNYMRNPPEFDAWGNEYVYKVSSNKQSYKFISKGPDGILDTDDDIIFSNGQFIKYPLEIKW